MTRTDRELLTELKADTCQCGKRKTPMQTFCRMCYFKLPPGLRQRLYNRIGNGYNEAYHDAIRFLNQ